MMRAPGAAMNAAQTRMGGCPWAGAGEARCRAAGFMIGNVFVLAGVPRSWGMLEDVGPA
jgi:hypothetical protein